MKLQFDAKQSYQIDAVNAVVDLFDGQPLNAPDYATLFQTFDTELFGSVGQTDLGIGNRLTLDGAAILKNLRRVQERNDLEVDEHLEPHGFGATAPAPLNFSVEMETGTGKTYVYLRTIFELSRRYGFKKFIVVVPSVAIREGVLKNLEITADHFRALFNHLEYEYFVYDAKKVNRLRQFALSNQVQILVINIDAFRKNFTGTEEEQKSNVIYKENDRLSGRQPIEFVRAAKPIVIVDEPQSVDSTAKAQEAIRALNPLCIIEVQSYQLERHVKKDEDVRPLRLNRRVYLDPEFERLWNSIKARTTYSVEYRTDEFVAAAVKAIQAMPRIEPVKVQVTEAAVNLERKGITGTMLRDAKRTVAFIRAVPDIIASLQNEVEVTRATIVRILRESGWLAEFLVNPRRFMDAVVYDSELECQFAEKLDQREDIKLFVKLPRWFVIDTPLGKYNPDWAILKHNDTVLYLVRETKGTRNYEKLPHNQEAEKLRCGRKHFEAIGADYDVVTSAEEV